MLVKRSDLEILRIVYKLELQVLILTLMHYCGRFIAISNTTSVFIGKEKCDYFEVRALDDRTIQVTFKHPLHASLLSGLCPFASFSSK